MNFDPLSYWNKRGKDYKADCDYKDVLDLARIIRDYNIQSVLEVGSGYGRIYQGLKAENVMLWNMKYAMVDISDSMRKVCKTNTGIEPYKWDGVELPFVDNFFDCVVSVNVMLHVPGAQIKTFVAEHLRVAKKYLFVVSGYKFKEKLAPHCFDNDYDELFGGKVIKRIDRNETNKVWLLRK